MSEVNTNEGTTETALDSIAITDSVLASASRAMQDEFVNLSKAFDGLKPEFQIQNIEERLMDMAQAVLAFDAGDTHSVVAFTEAYADVDSYLVKLLDTETNIFVTEKFETILALQSDMNNIFSRCQNFYDIIADAGVLLEMDAVAIDQLINLMSCEVEEIIDLNDYDEALIAWKNVQSSYMLFCKHVVTMNIPDNFKEPAFEFLNELTGFMAEVQQEV